MRRAVRTFGIILGLLGALQLSAATRVTVQKVNEIVASRRTGAGSDAALARRLADLELTERFTDARLEELLKAVGPRSREVLRILAGQSAFLEPPAGDLDPEPAPDPAMRALILKKAGAYVYRYVRNLPDFTCSRMARRFMSRRLESGLWGELSLVDTVTAEVTFRGGKEVQAIHSVSGAQRRPKDILGLSTSGEFGPVLISLFVRGGGLVPEWSHWEIYGGSRVAVFRYWVDSVHSDFLLGWCCSSSGESKSVISAYKGLIFVDAASGAIVRLTRQASHIPPSFPTRRDDTVVEYRPVDIGGKRWICPAKSVTVTDTFTFDARNPAQLNVHCLNEVLYTNYRKFEAESKFITDEVPPSEPSPAMEPAAPTQVQNAPPPPPERVRPAISRDLVRIPVVVRDGEGRTIDDLKKTDFELRVDGKPQSIAGWSTVAAGAAGSGPRYIALLFDDLHLSYPETAHALDAFRRVLADSQHPATYFSVRSVSGRVMLGITNSRARIEDALDQLGAPGSGPQGDEDSRTRSTLAALHATVLRTAAMPGTRSVVLISPGFPAPSGTAEADSAISAGARTGIGISVLDTGAIAAVRPYEAQGQPQPSTLLANLAGESGGEVFGGEEEFYRGLTSRAAPGVFSYVLGFTPNGLVRDGKLHKVSVRVGGRNGAKVLTQPEFRSALKIEDGLEQTEPEQELTLTSEEIRDLPVRLDTDFHKSNFAAFLWVTAHVDLAAVQFHKRGGMNSNTLTLMAGVFELSGHLVASELRVIDLEYSDERLAAKIRSGISLKTEFLSVSNSDRHIKSSVNDYVVRVILWDEEGQMFAATAPVHYSEQR